MADKAVVSPIERQETDEELLSIPDPNKTGALRGTPVEEDKSDGDR